MHAYSEPVTAKAVSFQRDDFVLYRDPVRFWGGEPDHTFVCRVSRVDTYVSGGVRYTLLPVKGGVINDARGEYMRLLPPADAMRDIDTAPLNTAGAVDGMTAAAMAWLTQQHQTANRRPELPARG
ncbi:hypothetical protein ACFCXH_00470 [Streptomyces nojiriensis]|uniref:hypothetical protein n=1 Tax=Streptomyces nojiriensis TaxID=66374 RepID=UPI0035DFC0C5